jgi:hypothetical protein
VETYEITLLKVRFEELKQEVAFLRTVVARLINQKKGETHADSNDSRGHQVECQPAEG